MFSLYNTTILINSGYCWLHLVIYLITIIIKMIEKKDILTCETGFLIEDLIR
jgi:hypothetical protein